MKSVARQLGYCLITTLVVVPTALADFTIPTAYQRIADQHGVKPDILYAIALAESGYTYQTRFQPWPWTLNVDGKGLRFNSRQSAYRELVKAIAEKRTVDVGLMQVNWNWHSKKFRNAWTALDPVNNVITAARLLSTLYQNSQNWWLAVEQYHSPGQSITSRQRAKRYRQRVYQLWQQIE